MSWLPGPPPELPLKGRRWRPDAIGTTSTARLRYVVVDELFADTAELSISSWPVVDPLGRLRFPDEPTAHVEVDARRMQTFLRRNRMPRKAVGRVLRAGDTFGITVRARELAAFLEAHESSETPERERTRMLDPKTWEWLEPTIFDITVPSEGGGQALVLRRPDRAAAPIGVRTPVTLPAPVPASSFHPGDFVADVDAEDAVYFLLNVGDGDTQLIVLPEFRGVRRALVVDVATTEKLPGLIEELAATTLFAVGSRFSIVVGTHPHDDHIRGMPEFIDRFGDLIDEYWEPGYYHPTRAFFETMRALEDRGIRQLQPTSGTTRFLGTGKVTVLAPAIGLRNRFDSYGVEINNASLSLMVEAPASRYLERDQERRYVRRPDTNKLLLGADAQTLSWGQVLQDFPQLVPESSPVAKLLREALGSDPLKADVFKIPHHASKRGVNLELVEAVAPKMCLISSVGGGGKYNFPHAVSMEAIREAMQPIGSTGGTRRADHQLNIHHTHGVDTNGDHLGSIALVMSPTGRKRHLWRFRDGPGDAITLAACRADGMTDG